jgi:hypothetical protein
VVRWVREPMGGWEALVRPDWVVGWRFLCYVDFFFPSVCVGAAAMIC